jgi:hypothetical protein
MLAACHQDESAHEISTDKGLYGRFTLSLVACLQELTLENTTYIELLDSVKLKMNTKAQTPSCNGFNRSRLVFSTDYPASGPRSLSLRKLELRVEDATQRFQVNIGTVDGVNEGTVFAVDGKVPSDTRLYLCVVGINFTTLRVAGDKPIPDGARVVVSNWNYKAPALLRVHLVSDSRHHAALFPKDVARRFIETTSDEAHVLLHNNGDVEWRTPTMQVKDVRGMPIPFGDPSANLPNIMDAVAHFNYFLENQPEESPGLDVSLEMYRLIGEKPNRKPDPQFPNMVRKKGSRYVAEFNSEDGAMYGFIIRNKSEVDVYPYLFFFDPEEYTIRVSPAASIHSCHLLIPT